MRSKRRIELLCDALTWALQRGIHGILDTLGHPSYHRLDMERELREIPVPESLKPVLDAAVRDGQINGVETLSPRPPVDPTREAELDQIILHQIHMIESLEKESRRLQDHTNERDAYQNMLIKLIVMGSSTLFEDKRIRDEWHRNAGDLLIHWSEHAKTNKLT